MTLALAIVEILCWPCRPPSYLTTHDLAPLGQQRATVYGSHEPGGTDVGCPAEAERVYGTRRLADLEAAGVPVVAHRSLPCGTRLLLCGPGGCALGWVGGRGPYGLDTPDGYRVATREEAAHVYRDPSWAPHGCEWRGEIDLVPAVAERVGLPGSGVKRKGLVTVWSIE